MDYLNNWCGNLSVWCGKRNFNTDKYKSIEVKNVCELKNSIDNTNDNFMQHTQVIQKGSSQIDNINDAVDNLLNAVKVNSWQDIVNQIKQPNSTESDKEAGNEKLHYSLSQTEILSFCGKLLDILKNGDLTFQSAVDRCSYLSAYFKVKSKIAKIQNILLVREILHREDNNNKDDETVVYKNNDQKLNKQQEELKLVINANYIAFQNSIREYKQLAAEMQEVFNDRMGYNVTENTDADYKWADICQACTKKEAAMGKLEDIERRIRELSEQQPETTHLSTTGNQYPDWKEQIKELKEKQYVLTKQIELYMLKDAINGQVVNFTDVFLVTDDKNDIPGNKELLNEDKIPCQFNIEKKDLSDFLNKITPGYLEEMNNYAVSNIDNEDFQKNISRKITQIAPGNNIQMQIDHNAQEPPEQPSCIGCLCPNTCILDPVAYNTKTITDRPNFNILMKTSKDKIIQLIPDDYTANNKSYKDNLKDNQGGNNLLNLSGQGMKEKNS